MSFTSKYRSDVRSIPSVFETMPRYKTRESSTFFDNDIPEMSRPRPPQPIRLTGEKVRDVEQACAILRESGGIILQQVRSGRPLERLTYTNESRLRKSFPTNLTKRDHVVVQALKPNVPRPFC
jgi:hypothetical protein